MLPKTRRIQKALFSKVFSTGRRLNSPHFLVNVSKIDDISPSRFAFSVSKKVCKKAVDRNRLRRQGYSAVSKHIKTIPPGFLFIFTFRKSPQPIIFSELEKEIHAMITSTTK